MTSRRVALIGLEILTFQELLSWIFGRVHIIFGVVNVCMCVGILIIWTALQTWIILTSRRRVMVQCFEKTKSCLQWWFPWKQWYLLRQKKGVMVSLVCTLDSYMFNAWMHKYNVLKDIWYLNTVTASVYYWLEKRAYNNKYKQRVHSLRR